jgi:hypothetical protein
LMHVSFLFGGRLARLFSLKLSVRDRIFGFFERAVMCAMI